MPAQLLDGNALSKKLRTEIAARGAIVTAKGTRPGLAVIVVGDNPASAVYVRNKVKACEDVGMHSILERHPADLSEAQLLKRIAELNLDPSIHGILVQLPLPKHIDSHRVIEAIAPEKDVDGFHPVSIGKLVLGQDTFLPATPYGILLMLSYYGIDLSGKHCVVVGRSNIVGTPMSILLSRNNAYGNATVTLTHSKTKDLKAHCLQADVIIAAIGIPYFLKADMVKEGAIVIDVGINRIEDASKKSGSRLVGDVDFDAVAPLCSYITPVPKGVGPMTICGLMQNTLNAVKNKR